MKTQLYVFLCDDIVVDAPGSVIDGVREANGFVVDCVVSVFNRLIPGAAVVVLLEGYPRVGADGALAAHPAALSLVTWLTETLLTSAHPHLHQGT